MEHEIEWGGDPEDIYVTTRGVATVEGLNAWMQEVLADPRYRPGLRALLDHRELDWSRLNAGEVERRVELVAKDVSRFGDAHVASVVARQVDYGVARMMQSLLDARPELRSRLRIFHSIEEARSWLASLPRLEAGGDG